MRSPTADPEEGLRAAKSRGRAVQGWRGPAWHRVPGARGGRRGDKNSLGDNYRNFRARGLFTRHLWERGERGDARRGGPGAAPGSPGKVRSGARPPPDPSSEQRGCSCRSRSLIFPRFHLPIKLPQIAKRLLCMQGTPLKDANLLSPPRT